MKTIEGIKLEVKHIFDSGANEIRVVEMIERLFQKRCFENDKTMRNKTAVDIVTNVAFVNTLHPGDIVTSKNNAEMTFQFRAKQGQMEVLDALLRSGLHLKISVETF